MEQHACLTHCLRVLNTYYSLGVYRDNILMQRQSLGLLVIQDRQSQRSRLFDYCLYSQSNLMHSLSENIFKKRSFSISRQLLFINFTLFYIHMNLQELGYILFP